MSKLSLKYAYYYDYYDYLDLLLHNLKFYYFSIKINYYLSTNLKFQIRSCVIPNDK